MESWIYIFIIIVLRGLSNYLTCYRMIEWMKENTLPDLHSYTPIIIPPPQWPHSSQVPVLFITSAYTLYGRSLKWIAGTNLLFYPLFAQLHWPSSCDDDSRPVYIAGYQLAPLRRPSILPDTGANRFFRHVSMSKGRRMGPPIASPSPRA